MRLNFVNKRVRDLSVRAEVIELAAICVALLSVCLVLPLVLQYFPKTSFARNGLDQWIMGPIVNCALIITGVNVRGLAKTSAVVLLPSVVHIALFYLFAIGTVFSLYMLPAIWLGNLILVLGIKYFYTHRKWNFAQSCALVISVKVGIIMGIFGMLVATGAIPQIPAQAMLPRMSINQLCVALIGCTAAFAIIKIFYLRICEKRS